MKKTIITLILIASLCMGLAACKSNSDEKPQNSTAVSETAKDKGMDNNGNVTDGNGIIGDKDDDINKGTQPENPVSKVVDGAGSVVSGTESVVENAADKIGDAAENVVSGTESVAENIAEGVGNGVSNVVSGTESVINEATDNSDNSESAE